MGIWTDRVLPRLVDRSLSVPEVDRLRAAVCQGLSGKVLEIGYGSGLNAPHYPDEVTSVHAVEPSDVAWSISQARRQASAVPVQRTGVDGSRLDAGDDTYDAVLSTFTLCTIPDVGAALTEVRRVLRPGGALHLLEHGRSPDDGIARWQRRLEPVQRRVAGGCHLTRDVPALLAAAGFTHVDLRTSYLPGPRVTRPWMFLYLGEATAPA